MKTYQFIGQGRGVPGLPHTLTDADAIRLGVEDLLKAALDNGNYEEVKQKAKTATVLPSVENKSKNAESDTAKN